MKVPCLEHGAHFRGEFTATLKKDCSVWQRWGLAKMPPNDKLLFWQWLFKAPFDEIWVRTGWQIGVAVHGERSRLKHAWQKYIKGYNRMSEAERQGAQKVYLKKQRKEQTDGS